MEDNRFSALLARYDAALEGIKEAERACGREGVRLAVAAKYATSEELDALVCRRGLTIIGENRADTLLKHYEEMQNRAEIHFIGHLQRNKVKSVIDKVSLIHSLDSRELARELDKEAGKLGIKVRVLAEINIGREESKSGVAPEELADFCRSILKYERIELCGFMTMAPRCESREEYFSYFKAARDLAYKVWREVLGREGEPELSMGMSESYRPAIAAGATTVRLGSSVFGRTTEDVLKMKINKDNINGGTQNGST